MIGEVLGNYRVVSRLGTGGMGTVYLAHHQILGSRAAIKVLLPEMSEQKRIVERFFDEARAATRIQDPGIVTVHEIGWHGTNAYIVMEHLNGETLASRLARYGQLPLPMALRLLQHCAIAMAAAHARGIIHRDLKPDNIFVVPDGAVPGGERTKILDFGIAKLIDNDDPNHHSRTQSGVIMGTPAYMSPEQCRGAGGVDHRTDIYALGCVMFAMLIGHPPFIAPTAGDLIASHLREPPALPSSLRPDIPAALDALVLRCLAKNPDERPQTMTELVRAAAQISGENLSIETIPPLVAASTPAPRASGPDTMSSHAPPRAADTTMRGATGESTGSSRPWRGGAILAGFAVIVVGAIAVIATRDRPAPADRAAPAAVPASQPPPVTRDAPAATVPPDAPPPLATTPPIDAPKLPAGSAKRPPRPRPTKGSSAAGSGSDYDPYKDR